MGWQRQAVPVHYEEFTPRHRGTPAKRRGLSDMADHPLVSVIIVCHNDGKWLKRCLDSLRQQSIFDRIELIIADNASGDGSDQVAQALTVDWPNARFFPTGGDNGFDVACNRAAALARGKYLYLLNPDTWLEPDCLEQFFRTVEGQQAAGAGGMILEYEDNTIQAKGSHGFDVFGSPVSPRRGADPQPLFCIAGFFFIRRDVFLALGMLDERFFMYGEEMDLCWRIWLSGRELVYAPTARIHHRGAALVNPAGGARPVENRTSLQKRFLANRNMLLVIAKNGQHILLATLIPCAALILLEGLATLALTRSLTITRGSCLKALTDFWGLRGHVRQERRRIRALRQRSDFWILRFVRFGFGRWGEVAKIGSRGFPKFNR